MRIRMRVATERGGGVRHMRTAAKLKNKVVRSFNNVSLKNKLFLLFGCTTFLQIVLSIFLNVITTRSIFLNKFSDYTNDMLYNLGNSVKIHIENVENVSSNILYNKRIYELLKNDTPADDKLKLYEEQREVNEILKELSYHQSEISSIYLFNNNSSCYSMNSKESSYEQSRIADAAEGADYPEWRCIDGDIYMLRRICDKNTFEKIGTQALKLKKDVFLNDIGKFDDFEAIEIFSDEFEPMYRYKEDGAVLMTKTDFDRIIKGRNGSYIDRKNSRFVCFSHIERLNWNIVSVIKLPKFYREINMVRNLILVFGIVTCLLTLILDLVFYKSILSPITRMVGSIKGFEKTNEISGIESGRKDEFGFLEEKYNDMIKHLDGLITTVYKERISRQNAQIQALQAQINPHFINNTLETINWMAQIRGAGEISDMILLLSKLMDIKTHSETNTVRFENDVEYVKCYCEIIKIRSGNSIEFRFDIEDKAKDVTIPALTLQPLVENAVSHGVDKVDRHGIIQIKAHIKDENLIIEITDNGAGADEESLREINEKLKTGYGRFSEKYIESENGSGIGLINVNERIKLICGEEYNIEVFGKKGHWFKAVCRLPMNGMTKEVEEC